MRFLLWYSLCVALTSKDLEQGENVLDGNLFRFQVSVCLRRKCEGDGGCFHWFVGVRASYPYTRRKSGRLSEWGGDLSLTVIRCDMETGGKRANFDYSRSFVMLFYHSAQSLNCCGSGTDLHLSPSTTQMWSQFQKAERQYIKEKCWN